MKKDIIIILLTLTPFTFLVNFACKAAKSNTKEKTQMYNKLTKAEELIIVHKGTEPPFSGEFNNHFQKGVYTCKRCSQKLFKSSDKFKSHCGWPSFDDQIPGKVVSTPDPDGIRTEITCANCNAHLGHIFTGERLTQKNKRYCVNSLSLDFIPENTAKAVFAAGCFWGVEYYFQNATGVISTTVGYTGGKTKKPTYSQVCSEKTGHAEAVEITYDPARTTYETLAKLFFEIHDFTQLNRQGPDTGDQYRTAIFYKTPEQKQIAEKLIQQLILKGYDVKTQINPAKNFYPAEDYHQKYYQKNKKLPYCHTRKKIFD